MDLYLRIWRWRRMCWPMQSGGFVAIVLMLAGCGENSSDERIASYNKRLGNQGELTSTHLIVKWTDGADPVTLKIPHVHLEGSPGSKDEKGELEKLYVVFALRGGESHSQGERVAAQLDLHLRKRLIVISRNSSRESVAREHMRQQVQDKNRYWRNPDLAGLEHYSRLMCSTPEHRGSDAEAALIREKPPTDPSPPNCRVDGAWDILISPPPIRGDGEGVRIRCATTGCNAYFLAGKRGATTDLTYEELAHWQDIVEPARRLVDGFVSNAEPTATASDQK